MIPLLHCPHSFFVSPTVSMAFFLISSAVTFSCSAFFLFDSHGGLCIHSSSLSQISSNIVLISSSSGLMPLARSSSLTLALYLLISRLRRSLNDRLDTWNFGLSNLLRFSAISSHTFPLSGRFGSHTDWKPKLLLQIVYLI